MYMPTCYSFGSGFTTLCESQQTRGSLVWWLSGPEGIPVRWLSRPVVYWHSSPMIDWAEGIPIRWLNGPECIPFRWPSGLVVYWHSNPINDWAESIQSDDWVDALYIGIPVQWLIGSRVFSSDDWVDLLYIGIPARWLNGPIMLFCMCYVVWWYFKGTH